LSAFLDLKGIAMAQDATPVTRQMMREAQNAGDDAAADAREEALRQGTEVTGEDIGPEVDATKGADKWHRFEVNVWITDLNSVEFGVYKHQRNKAKSRQFTQDMDVYAEVTENGQRTGLLAYREQLWKKQQGFERRLVLKMFGEKLNWRATMDLMLARSVQETVGARGLAVQTFAINTNDSDQVVYLSRSANKWPLMGENFSFFLMEGESIRFYRLRQDLYTTIGRDYSLFDAMGTKIGVLDGKLLSLGGKWKCKIKREHADKHLMHVLKMFVGMLVFNRGCRKHVARLAGDVARGVAVPKLQRQEADLYMNPRRVR
jgi:hypothetical protein